MACPLLKHLLLLLGIVFTLCFVISSGLFDNVSTDVGFSHYAEPTIPVDYYYFISILNVREIMPANAIVNVGYVVVALAWLRVVEVRFQEGNLNERERNLFSIFCWMSFVYGFVQLARIVLQTHRLAVLDQWCTLPFFMWVAVWSDALGETKSRRWNVIYASAMMIASCLSYATALIFAKGFELALGFHLLLAADAATRVLRRFGGEENGTVRSSYGKALLCCAGFFLLKVYDLELGYVECFRRLSGHFWSKVCDVLQVHYVCEFFLNASLEKFKLNAMKGQVK